MNFFSLPSLEDMALIKVAIVLWNPDDIRASLARPSSSKLSQIFINDKEKTRELEDKVLEKLNDLKKIEKFRKKITFLKMVGSQILKWLKYHCAIYFCTDLPNDFCWTPDGKIDDKKTAEILIKDEKIDIDSRYKLACIYCLKDDILNLWKKIPENHRKSFYSEKTPKEVRQHKLVVFWTYVIKDKLNKITDISGNHRSPYQYAFEMAAENGIKAATQYFLQMLTTQERKESLVRTIRHTARELKCLTKEFKQRTEHRIEVLFFLLSQTDEQQQMELFKTHPYAVLSCFLYWPRQPLFMKMTTRLWMDLSGDVYEYLMKDILYKVLVKYEDYDYRQLFEEFWLQSNEYHKKYIINTNTFDDVISNLFELKDKENIRLILKSATATEKKNIISNPSGKRICSQLLCHHLKHLLKFFIQECLFSKNEMIIFKKEFDEYLTEYQSRNTYDEDSKILFRQLMDKLIDKNDRLSADESSSD